MIRKLTFRALALRRSEFPTSDLRELMQLIIEENSFKLNEKHSVQTHGIAMGAKMVVAFSVVFMADMEK